MRVIAIKKRSLVAGFHPGYRCREVLEDEIGIMTGLDDEIFRFIGDGWRLFHPARQGCRSDRDEIVVTRLLIRV